MVSQALIVFGVSVFLFTLLSFIVLAEQRRERRFIASGLRAWLDGWLERLGNRVRHSWSHFVRYILQLHWYYSIHSVLRAILRVIVAMYSYFEGVFERNRTRAKELRAEKRHINELGHLHQVAEHKEETALTEAQQKKLRHQKLEERN